MGDYAYIENMTAAYMTFDALNKMVGNGSSEGHQSEKIDHFITMGDNIYPVIPEDPTEGEFNIMLDLFNKEHLKDIPVMAIRGNHDCYYDKNTWLNTFKMEPKWDVPYYYFSREIEIDQEGNKIGFLMIDSCLLLCSNSSFTHNKTSSKISQRVTKEEMFMRPRFEDLKELHDDACQDPWYVSEGNRMVEWIEGKVAEWARDDKIIWKATV